MIGRRLVLGKVKPRNKAKLVNCNFYMVYITCLYQVMNGYWRYLYLFHPFSFFCIIFIHFPSFSDGFLLNLIDCYCTICIYLYLFALICFLSIFTDLSAIIRYYHALSCVFSTRRSWGSIEWFPRLTRTSDQPRVQKFIL